MFRRLRERIERALEAKEAARPISRDDYDDILRAMRQEVIDLRARLPKAEKQVVALRAEARETVRRAELAHEKARAAQEAGRVEEAQRTMELVGRAVRQAEEMKRQATEAEAELAELRAETADKLEKLKAAQKNRDVMIARSRRAGTARQLDEALRGPDSGLKRFERAEEDLEHAEDLAAASREVDEALGGPASTAELDFELRQLETADDTDDIERRLLELKREVEGDSES